MNKIVTRMLRRGRDVLSSVGRLAGRVASVLDPILGAYLREGEPRAGTEAFLIGMLRWLEDGLGVLVGLEHAHRGAVRELRLLRLVRDDWEGVLYERLLSVRRTFEDAFGPGTAAIYLGLGPKLGEASRDVLERFARHAVNALLSPRFSPPPPKVEGLWERPGRYAAQVLEALEGFEGSLAAITAQKRNVEVALVAKTEYLAELKDRLRWTTRFFEALYHLSGLGAHAERLRTTTPSRKSAKALEKVAGDEPVQTAA